MSVVVSWSHNAGCEQVISSLSFDILWQHTLFASEMMKKNTTNEATIVLHIKRDASVAYLCVCHIRFGILREKPHCTCQKFMSNGNKTKSTVVDLKQNYMSQDRTLPNAKCQRLQDGKPT
jgi:hypothetical protein